MGLIKVDNIALLSVDKTERDIEHFKSGNIMNAGNPSIN